ncbi:MULTISPECIES: hypothetical protein [Luteimonas]|uniref:SnoaL-like domain-containing protein n=1 Tax=Luteimonas chenhongjianii TaxID=2006110 RepID=A0A290XGV1_9GAMM|nr:MULTISPECIES: hypothetical protein [Luteimonas]ATD68166.1 hypothetical protein CNR27_12590 [Luteimonas chenhongjianii]RPD88165.1 hypothetical protein EGK76_03060 [Luteimonas sp. 100069]
MSHRAWWLVIAAVMLLGIAVAVHDGLRRGQDRQVTDDAIAAPPSSVSPGTGTPADGGNGDTAQARDASMHEAVSALHSYLAMLFQADHSEADALWAGGRPAPHGEEALRELHGVTGIRVDNRRPEPLDTAPVPRQLRIPVNLRIGVAGPLRRFEGHYDLQREADGWRIRAASIAPSPVRG